MDNFIKNVSLNDIIFDEKKEKINDSKELEDLKKSIQQYGIVEPLLLQEKNGKYEILLGKKRYLVAKKLGMSTVPALVKNDNSINYQALINSNENLEHNKFINPIDLNQENNELQEKKIVSKEKKSSEKLKQKTQDNLFSNIMEDRYELIKNSDIINLSELNKKENERDEFQMNNNMVNNQEVAPTSTQNMGGMPQQVPTFGGRFFPSLEDEATDMNMGSANIIGQALTNATGTVTNNSSNLIDLTEDNRMDSAPYVNTNIGTEQPSYMQPSTIQSGIPPQNNNTTMGAAPAPVEINSSINQVTPTSNILGENVGSSLNTSVNPTIDNLPNISATNNIMGNSFEKTNIEQNSMNIPQQNTTQFDMSQSVTPLNTSISPTVNSFNDTVGIDTLNQPVISTNSEQSPELMSQQASFGTPEATSSTSLINEDLNQNIMNQPSPMPNQEVMAQNINGMSIQAEMPIENSNISPIQPTNTMNDVSISPTPLEKEEIKPSLGNTIEENQQFPQKDVVPILNAIKGLAENLKSFGYNINMMEEDLQNSTKLIIEIEK